LLETGGFEGVVPFTGAAWRSMDVVLFRLHPTFFMEADRQPGRRLSFGVFDLDLGTGELRKRGARVRLQQQPFQVLAVLIERRGDVVSREELQQKLWPANTFVDFDHGLNKAINKIRGALGDSADTPRFVETVARRGYRFVADVTVTDEVLPPGPAVAADMPLSPVGSPADPGITPVPSGMAPTRRTLVASALLTGALAVALAFWKLHSETGAPPSIRSLAVLPLESLSGDASQDYFADGMTDELIADLGQISALRVISRTSVMGYKHTRKPLPQIARELNVDAVLEGTVLRSGEQVRITAQLIEGGSDRHLWSQSYQGELRDTLALQNNIARAVADQIRVRLNPQEQAALMSVTVVNPVAYESYLKGRYFWNKRTAAGLTAALAYFNQAVDENPQYSQAYSGLADTYALLGDWQYAVMTPREALPKAKAAAIKALDLDGGLGEAHTSLAFCLDGFDWDFAAAEKEFQKAIALKPGYATAHHWYAWHLALVHRYDEATAEMRKALNLDPLSLIINADLAELLALAHSYDESIRQSRKTLELDPNFALAHNHLGQAYLQTHMNEQAIAELQKAVTLSGGSATCVANLARAFAASSRRSEAVPLLNDLKSRSDARHSYASEIAVIYASLGDADQAMVWLERGYQERFNPGVLLRPGFDPLRMDPRFENLVARVGLPH
jgi:TolB-like protein/DNA-binding winged helix-turn-helix (wHTH) protein/Flp pilus assembly protein TadD